MASTACLFGRAALTAQSITTQITELVVLSPTAFERWTAFEPFRCFVFGLLAHRVAELMALAEAVAAQRLDQRLAAVQLGHGSVVNGTHQALADELRTGARSSPGCSSASSAQAGWPSSLRQRCEPWPLVARRAVDGRVAGGHGRRPGVISACCCWSPSRPASARHTRCWA